MPVAWRCAAPQTYPTRPIIMDVPFAAGGPTDTIARVVAQRMALSLGQSLVIENVWGAGSARPLIKGANIRPE